MHTATTPRGAKRQRLLASRMASDFDAPPLHNTVHDAIGEDQQLGQLLDVVAETEHIQRDRESEYGRDALGVDDLGSVSGTVSYIGRERAREVVAESCARIVDEIDDWVADGDTDEETAANAREEADEWLRANTNVSDRLGLLSVVGGGADRDD